ncbi:MAG: hypothetical protein HY748_15955 [Elusimicrobia bacterium]|nr:hypothetical protein [Elusimicrobiota bacterium]
MRNRAFPTACLSLAGAFLTLFLPFPGGAAAQSGGQLCTEAGLSGDCLDVKRRFALSAERSLKAPPAEAGKPCPKSWERSKQGNCWIETAVFGGAKAWAFVHPKGWVVDPRCLRDKRFTQAELMAALDSAWRKMSPATSLSQGGCLSHFNPWWGKELVDGMFEKSMYLSCPEFDPKGSSCADRGTRDSYEVDEKGFTVRRPEAVNLLSIRNVARCISPGATGLAGVVFHETLHAAGADNFSTEKHNKAYDLEQYVFVRDRVYAAEAVCFFGTDPKRRELANILQCRATAEYHAEDPRQHLCEGFGASFTDMPAGFIKH